MRALAALWLAWCFARPTPLSCDMQFPPTRACDNVTAEQQEAELDRLAFEADAAVEPLEDFAARIVPLAYPKIKALPDHWRRILAVFEPSRYGGQKWAINMPPRHGKTICGLLAILWQMSNWPELRHAYATYGQKFSEQQNRTVIARLCAAMVRWNDENPARSKRLINFTTQNADVLETVEGGALYITSRDSPLLGKGIDGIGLIDDPYKNRQEAESAQIQETVWDWYQDVFSSRLEGDPSQYILHQRWNVDDMTGRLEEGGAGFRKLVIKAINDNGEALWPAVKGLADLRLMEQQNAYGFASMWQQDPIPRGSCMFNEPSRYDLAEWLKTLDPLAYRWCIALDVAITADEAADHSAALLCAFQGSGGDMKGWAVDLLHEQCEAPDLVPLVIEMRRRWMRLGIATLPIVVEGNGAGGPVYQAMRRLAPADEVRRVIAAVDKKTRATPLAAGWNTNRFFVPKVKDGPGWAEYVREHRRFTGRPKAKDDRVDASAHGWNFEFRRTPTLVRGPRKFALHGLG